TAIGTNEGPSFEAAAKAAEIAGITFSDSTPPTLTLTPFQVSLIPTFLSEISSPYTLLQTEQGPSGATISGSSSAVGNILSISNVTAGQLTITPAGDGKSFTIGYGGQSDHLSDIQALQFGSYREFVAQTPGPASAITTGNVTELYSAVLSREPDVPGLGF